ncbi:hypothetical protein [Pontibacter kalidii]|uniref:hypothetical protein n=1 Tax=Pontibacter kalidii TaxID=2592049 RepID=UPI00224D9D44|nr:hypothetical protein [Pontibacter kalidii]
MTDKKFNKQLQAILLGEHYKDDVQAACVLDWLEVNLTSLVGKLTLAGLRERYQQEGQVLTNEFHINDRMHLSLLRETEKGENYRYVLQVSCDGQRVARLSIEPIRWNKDLVKLKMENELLYGDWLEYYMLITETLGLVEHSLHRLDIAYDSYGKFKILKFLLHYCEEISTKHTFTKCGKATLTESKNSIIIGSQKTGKVISIYPNKVKEARDNEKQWILDHFERLEFDLNDKRGITRIEERMGSQYLGDFDIPISRLVEQGFLWSIFMHAVGKNLDFNLKENKANLSLPNYTSEPISLLNKDLFEVEELQPRKKAGLSDEARRIRADRREIRECVSRYLAEGDIEVIHSMQRDIREGEYRLLPVTRYSQRYGYKGNTQQNQEKIRLLVKDHIDWCSPEKTRQVLERMEYAMTLLVTDDTAPAEATPTVWPVGEFDTVEEIASEAPQRSLAFIDVSASPHAHRGAMIRWCIVGYCPLVVRGSAWMPIRGPCWGFQDS